MSYNVNHVAEDRPVMSSVLFVLGSDGAILLEPKEPGFLVGRGSITETSCISPNLVPERNSSPSH